MSAEIKYPRAVFFIISHEFFERFTFYGIRAVLSIYFTSALFYSNDNATVMFHAFVMLTYIFPVLGAVIADSWLGKYKTILYLAIIYCVGSIVLTFSSFTNGSNDNSETANHTGAPVDGPSGHQEPLSVIGLILIAIGVGGIKPCVSAFGGDQFKVPEQKLQLTRFFSIFYFAVNAGSLFSTFITPIFRQDFRCFGQNSCFPLAFGVPTVIMVLALRNLLDIRVFWLPTHYYRELAESSDRR